MACQGQSREAMRSTLDKAYGVKYTRYREVRLVQVYVLEQEMTYLQELREIYTSFRKEVSVMCLLTPERIISLKFGKIENNKKISNLGWGDYKDVLYSFLGIYTLGVYIFAKDKKSRYSIGDDKIIRIAGTKRWLYSRKYIKGHLNEFSELTNTKEIMDFAEVYNSEGNVIPIWPGGNEFKGKAGCYDIPDIFFSKYGNMEEIYIQHILHKNIEDVALTSVLYR